MDKQEESKQEEKRGFPRCTFKTNLAIGLCFSFLVVAILVFVFRFPPTGDYPIFKKVLFVLVLGTLFGFLGGSLTWFLYDSR